MDDEDDTATSQSDAPQVNLTPDSGSLAVQNAVVDAKKGCSSARVGKEKAKSDGQSKPLRTLAHTRLGRTAFQSNRARHALRLHFIEKATGSCTGCGGLSTTAWPTATGAPTMLRTENCRAWSALAEREGNESLETPKSTSARATARATSWKRDQQEGVKYSYLRKGIAGGAGTAMKEWHSDSEHCFSSRRSDLKAHSQVQGEHRPKMEASWLASLEASAAADTRTGERWHLGVDLQRRDSCWPRRWSPAAVL